MDDGFCGFSGWKGIIRVKTMLNQVLFEINNAKRPITIHELSRKMGVEPDALEGMIQFLVRKGLLQDDNIVKNCNIDSGSCTTSCCGTSDCIFIAKMPKTYSIPQTVTYQKPTKNHDHQ
jgi:hypothetical protein